MRSTPPRPLLVPIRITLRTEGKKGFTGPLAIPVLSGLIFAPCHRQRSPGKGASQLSRQCCVKFSKWPFDPERPIFEPCHSSNCTISTVHLCIVHGDSAVPLAALRPDCCFWIGDSAGRGGFGGSRFLEFRDQYARAREAQFVAACFRCNCRTSPLLLV